MNRMDNVYTERAQGVQHHRFQHGALPSDFFRQNVFISFQGDALGIQLRSYIGVENLLWSSERLSGNFFALLQRDQAASLR